MRFGFLAVMFLAVMLTPSSLLAQSDTVRGCVAETTHQGVWLVVGVVEDRDYQAFHARTPLDRGVSCSWATTTCWRSCPSEKVTQFR